MKKSYKIRIIFLALFCLCVNASLHAAEVSPPVSGDIAVQAREYLLGAGDKIKITVYGEDELSGIYGISAQGTLSFPLLGELQAQGLDLPTLERIIVKGLKEGFLVNPSVAMEMDSYRPFYILGEVREPGSYDYIANMNILNAIALAGGFTYRANRSTVEVLRKKGQEEVLKEVNVESGVIPGDIITVKERFF